MELGDLKASDTMFVVSEYFLARFHGSGRDLSDGLFIVSMNMRIWSDAFMVD